MGQGRWSTLQDDWQGSILFTYLCGVLLMIIHQATDLFFDVFCNYFYLTKGFFFKSKTLVSSPSHGINVGMSHTPLNHSLMCKI